MLFRVVQEEAAPLIERVERFKERYLSEIEGKFPDMPAALSDRMQEGTEGIAAMADLLDCGDEFREALVQLLTAERPDRAETMRHRLLRDLRAVFAEHLDGHSGMHTDDILKHLRFIEESPWKTYYGRRLEANDLASLLKQYEVHPMPIRIGTEVRRGYKVDHLHPVWERYLPDGEDGTDEEDE